MGLLGKITSVQWKLDLMKCPGTKKLFRFIECSFHRGSFHTLQKVIVKNVIRRIEDFVM